MTATATDAPPTLTLLRGVVQRVFHSGPAFSAGLLRTDDGEFVRFRGAFCATEGDLIGLVGRWTDDRKYGRQFHVERLSYDLPETPDGLVQYLAGHPAFTGVGLKTATRIVEYAGSLERSTGSSASGRTNFTPSCGFP